MTVALRNSASDARRQPGHSVGADPDHDDHLAASCAISQLRQQPHRDEHRPQRPRHPHGAPALGQRPRRGGGDLRRRAGQRRRRHALGHPPDHESGPHEQQPHARCRAARRRGRCRTRPAPPWPSRRRSWRGAPARRPPTRTPRSRPVPAWPACVSASTVSRLAWATKSVCTTAAACAGSFSARAWSPRMPNASTAVPIGPCSATIDVDQRGVRGKVVGVEFTHVHRGGARLPARPRPLVKLVGACGPPAPPSRPAPAACASSIPISLRPPKITIGSAPVSSTAVIISCASVGA